MENKMNRRMTLALGTMALLGMGLAIPTSDAVAQTAQDLVGNWTLVSAQTVQPDGKKSPTFGANPRGILIFGSDGRFSYLFTSADLPKFASNNRGTGTPKENTAVVRGSIATFGTYSVVDKGLVIKVEFSTFPNWNGTEQKRTIAISGDEMKWTNPAGSAGGVVELGFKRAK